MTLWNRVKRPLEIALWVGVLGFVAYRVAPQVGAALGGGGEDTRVSSSASVIRTLDGSELTLDALKGKVVLVNVWATWCPPCVIEMPGFQDVYEEYAERGFLISVFLSRHISDSGTYGNLDIKLGISRKGRYMVLGIKHLNIAVKR